MSALFKPHRFVFAPRLVDMLMEFSKLHQHDDRKTYKEAWDAWIKTDETHTHILEEERRLRELGFIGDTIHKMFLSSRYYYRNKKLDEPTVQPSRKKYNGLPKEVLHAMDAHIREQFPSTDCKPVHNMDIVSPGEGFLHFCEEKRSLIGDYVKTMSACNNNNNNIESNIRMAIAKFKKTYKNRFYIIRTSLSK